MADDPRRFDDLVRVVADLRRQVAELQSVTLNRLATHVHAGGGGGGSVDSVTAGDATITIGGTASDPTVKVTPSTFQPLDSDLTAIAGISPTNDDVIQRKGGVWVARSMSQVKTDLALTKSDVGLSNVTNNAQVTGVTAADGTITIAGTSTAPSVAVGTGIAQSKVTNLTTDLAAKFAAAGGSISGDTTIQGSGKAIRLRQSGGGLDLEVYGASLVLSGWSGAAFTGSQTNGLTMGTDGKVSIDHVTSSANTFATVTTQQTTTSTSYTDLATTGPTCSVTLPSSQNVLVIIRSRMGNTATSGSVYMAFAASGATTLAAADQLSITQNGSGNAEQYCSFWVVPCNSGTTTFTSKYRVVSGTGQYTDRQMVVIPL